jgi:hypothetical protein
LPTRSVARPPADQEFLALPPGIRLEFEEILDLLVRQPFRSGPGFTVQSVRSHPGLWKLKLTTVPPKLFRAAFEVDGDVVRFLAFGPRPEFYRKLTHKDRKGTHRRELPLKPRI